MIDFGPAIDAVSCTGFNNDGGRRALDPMHVPRSGTQFAPQGHHG
jgi:hypothetical protein